MIPIIAAVNAAGEHHIQVLLLLSSTTRQQEAEKKERELTSWLEENAAELEMEVEPVITHSRLEVIEDAAQHADLLIMHGTPASRVGKFLFGSLVDSVSVRIRKTLLVVYNGEKTVT